MLYQRYISLAHQLALLMFIAYPAYGFGASVGQVDFSVGQVVAMSADGAKRPLQKCSEVNSGDSINMEKVIIDGKGGERVLPYLPLDRLSKPASKPIARTVPQPEVEESRSEPSHTHPQA